MKKWVWISAVFLALNTSAIVATESSTTLYQAGTLASLMQNVYEGSTPFSELLKHGDFGLGTDQGVSGELVIDDSKIYLASPEGESKIISPETKTPFAMIVQFHPNQTFDLQNIKNITQFGNEVDAHLPSTNFFYAMKVTGVFDIVGRAFTPVKKGVPLAAWLQKNQHIYHMNNIPGTLIIFRSPNYSNSFSVAGYHIHFLSQDKKYVFHLYGLSFKNAKVEVEKLTRYEVMLPTSQEFVKAKIEPLSGAAIRKMENR